MATGMITGLPRIYTSSEDEQAPSLVLTFNLVENMVQDKVKRNIATFLVLPWLQLNESSFGSDNLINCYVGEAFQVVVEVKDRVWVPIKFYEDALYVQDYDLEDRTVIIYQLPLEFHDDLTKFADGKYSQFSDKAKKNIRRFSGLVNGHYFLHVIDRSPALRQRMIEDLRLDKDVLSPEAELHDKPKMCEFYTYSNQLS